MWKRLNQNKKEHYKKLILNFASLSEAFAQKTNDDVVVAPIVNSKFQETCFQRCFNAHSEDISNTSYDASLILEDNSKYVVGIKSFNKNSKYQKIAQFKKESTEWHSIIDNIIENSKNMNDISEINFINQNYYEELAIKIAESRNDRIFSSIENLRGFNYSDDDDIKSIYHVLMTTKKGESPKIYVGEMDYSPIFIENIKIEGCTQKNNPGNFIFNDSKHQYKYTSSDSQLYMKFDNDNIIQDIWDVSYVEDAFSVFESISIENKYDYDTLESHSWRINIQPYSGYNSFYGTGSKLGMNQRRKRIDNIIKEFQNDVPNELLIEIEQFLEQFLIKHKDYSNDDLAEKRKSMMFKLQGYEKLKKKISNLVYRPMREMYIPIPNSKKFHKKFPKFFGGISEKGTSKPFKLQFLPSKDIVIAEVRQESGKAIQSIDKQSILGHWILNKIFRLSPYEQLTDNQLIKLGINGIRLTKSDDIIQLEFIWIDDNNLPKDYWE